MVINEPGLQVECDGCHCDLTHSVRIKCADHVCEPGDGVDICPQCFTKGVEFGQHRRTHAYRIIVSLSSSIYALPLAHGSSRDTRNCIRILFLKRIGERMSEFY